MFMRMMAAVAVLLVFVSNSSAEVGVKFADLETQVRKIIEHASKKHCPNVKTGEALYADMNVLAECLRKAAPQLFQTKDGKVAYATFTNVGYGNKSEVDHISLDVAEMCEDQIFCANFRFDVSQKKVELYYVQGSKKTLLGSSVKGFSINADGLVEMVRIKLCESKPCTEANRTKGHDDFAMEVPAILTAYVKLLKQKN
ncbi:MAG: hypothetical protein OXR68_03550 [Alphaproteobacteria bacterium]|nr:hypothetical protein [Alphaproteobacteria bacterium]MDD9919682.1 hypothetical protein [Alphaproteobacteria bacterium]